MRTQQFVNAMLRLDRADIWLFNYATPAVALTVSDVQGLMETEEAPLSIRA